MSQTSPAPYRMWPVHQRHLARHFLSVLCFASPAAVLAQPSLPPTLETEQELLREPIDNLRQFTPDWEQRYLPPGQQQPSPPPAAARQERKTPKVTDDDLRRHPKLAEIVITTAIQKQNWQTLEKVLPIYEASAGHDPMLVRYAKGALLRQQRRHGEAIAEYQAMLQADPGLDYVRFDLGFMLYENKQYRDATQELQASLANPALDIRLRGIAKQVLEQIAQAERANPRLRLRIVHNNNVNQGGDEREVALGGLLFVKNENSLPQSSWGSQYALLLNQERNIGGNDFLGYDLSVQGLRYFSASDYDENAVSIAFNYKNQNINGWVAVGPALVWQWQASQRYSHGQGLNASIGHWITPRLQLSAYARWLKRSYYNTNLASYEGDTSSIAPGLLWLLTPRTVLMAGASYQRDSLRAGSESFRQRSVNVGINTQMQNGLNISAFSQLGFRRYDDHHLLFYTWRKDRRVSANISIGHTSLNFAGFEPKLGFQYERVRSNISSLYSRNSRQWMLTLEKRF